MSGEVEPCVIGDALWWSYVPDDGYGDTRWVKHPITHITANRVYYTYDGRETYTDRAKLEQRGWCMPPRGGVGCALHLDGPEEQAQREADQRRAWLDGQAEQVKQLRQDAAEAHPDRGGDPAAFREKHARYAQAKSALTRRRGAA